MNKVILKSTYFKSIVSSYTVTLLQIIIGIFMTPFILNAITKSEFGIYTLLVETIGFLTLFDFGFAGALGVHISRNSKNIKLISAFASVTATLQLILGLIVVAICFLIANNYQVIFVKSDVVDVAQVIIIFSFGFLFSMLSRTYSTILIAMRQIHIDNYFRIIGLLMKSALIFILVELNHGIIGLALANVFVECLLSFIAFVRVRMLFKDLTILYFKFDIKDFVVLWHEAKWFFIGTIGVLLIERFDKILTGNVLGIDDIAIIAITSRLFEISRSMITMLINNIRPYLGVLVGEKNFKLLRDLHGAIQSLNTAIAISIVTLITYVNESFLSIWVGKGFYGGLSLCLVLGFNLIYYAWKLPSRAYLTANLIVREQSLAGLFEGIFAVIIGIKLGNMYGMTGLVSGTIVTGILFQAPFYTYLLVKYDLDSLRDIGIRSVKILFTLVSLGAVLLYFMIFHPLDNLLSFSSVIFLFSFGFITLVIFFVFYRKEIGFMRNLNF